MNPRTLCVAALTGSLVLAAACSRSASSEAPADPSIHLRTPQAGGAAYIEVVGLDDDTLEALEGASYSADQWAALLRISVAPDAPPVLGKYIVANRALRFEPAFRLDAGREYSVRFDPARLPDNDEERGAPLVTTVALPAPNAAPSTFVEKIYPSSELVPENQLRLYIHFSAPMGLRPGREYVSLVDDRGNVVPGAFLPLDYELWNPERTRLTVFFDPGRVKTGILPNEQMGRPLEAGRRYTLVISKDWPDSKGLPLTKEFRRALRAGPAQTQPLDPSMWRIVPPVAGSRGPLVVAFPAPLDRALLMRALGVRLAGMPLEGTIDVGSSEREWMFTPRSPWRGGTYDLIALSILEDVAGNQIGRAFEVDNFDTVDKGPDPDTVTLPFRISE